MYGNTTKQLRHKRKRSLSKQKVLRSIHLQSIHLNNKRKTSGIANRADLPTRLSRGERSQTFDPSWRSGTSCCARCTVELLPHSYRWARKNIDHSALEDWCGYDVHLRIDMTCYLGPNLNGVNQGWEVRLTLFFSFSAQRTQNLIMSTWRHPVC